MQQFIINEKLIITLCKHFSCLVPIRVSGSLEARPATSPWAEANMWGGWGLGGTQTEGPRQHEGSLFSPLSLPSSSASVS